MLLIEVHTDESSQVRLGILHVSEKTNSETRNVLQQAHNERRTTISLLRMENSQLYVHSNRLENLSQCNDKGGYCFKNSNIVVDNSRILFYSRISANITHRRAR